MKIKLLLLSFFLGSCTYQLLGQTNPNNPLGISVSLDLRSQNLLDAFSAIEANYPISFFYREDWIPRDEINKSWNGVPLAQILDELLKGSSLGYRLYDNFGIIIARETDLVNLEGFSYESYVADVNELDESKKKQLLTTYVVGDSMVRPLPLVANIKGTVYNYETEEALAGAQIGFPDLKKLVLTDSMGRFDAELPTGTHEVILEGAGHEKRTITAIIYSDGEWDIALSYTAYQLEEVLMEGEAEGQSSSSAEAGKIQLSMIDVRRSPSLMGEVDIVNTILLVPGVSTVGEAATGFNVRGGNIDQNLVMQDGQMIFNSAHLLGFYSIFNPDVVQNLTLYKGHIPAQYGGRVSSVLDVEMTEGSFKRLRGKGSFGLLSSKLMFDGPIIKNNTSFLIAARAAYPNLIGRYIKQLKDLTESNAYYGDLTMKITQKLGDLGKLSLFGYASQDVFKFRQSFGFDWQNLSAGLEWSQIFSSRFSTRLRVSAGRYLSSFFNGEGADATSNTAGVDNLKWKADAQIVPVSSHNINLGWDGTLYKILNNDVKPFGEISSAEPRSALKDDGLEMGLYINDEFDLNYFLGFSAGLRFSFYQNLGPFEVWEYSEGLVRSPVNVTGSTVYEKGETIQTYTGLEPRISARIRFNESTTIKASYNRIFQYIHLLSNTISATPVDVWQVSNPYFPAQSANNFSLGFFKDFQGKIWQSSLEFFYRTMDGLVVAKNFAELLGNDHVETEVLNAQGLAYGSEFSLRYNLDQFDVEGSVTYMRSFRQTINNAEGQQINNGDWFPSDFDTPLNINISFKYFPRPSRTIAASFVYRTGRPVTTPQGVYSIYPSLTVPLFSERNQFRIPDYHRLDLSYTFDDGMFYRRKTKTDLTVSLYNLYARKNAYSIFFRKEDGRFNAYQLAILGTVLPFISYNFSF